MSKQSNYNLTILGKIQKLQSNSSIMQQFILIEEIFLENLQGQEALLDLLVSRQILNKTDISYIDSVIFEFLVKSSHGKIRQSLHNYFPQGLVSLHNLNLSIDYQQLQNLLIMHKYQEADQLTQKSLCQLAGLDIYNDRNWLYFTDISMLPLQDLTIIDKLWKVYSRDKFGFSKQRQIWLANDCNWEKFWQQIGWKSHGIPRRYPQEFLWNINAPSGHLPLFNQLRGVQVLLALFNHIAWNQ